MTMSSVAEVEIQSDEFPTQEMIDMRAKNMKEAEEMYAQMPVEHVKVIRADLERCMEIVGSL